MKKTDKIIKLKGTTMHFPIVVATEEEIQDLYTLGHIPPSFIKQITNSDYIDTVVEKCRKTRLSKQDAYVELVKTWSNKTDEMMLDLQAFSDGDLDIIDLVFKYTRPYKDVNKFFKAILIDVDVDTYWKKHKKHAQKRTTQQIYGVEHTAMLKDVQEKRKITSIERYGVDNVMKLQEYRDKYRQRMLETHGVAHNFQMTDAVLAWRKKFFKTLTTDVRWSNVLKDIAKQHNTGLSAKIFENILPITRRDFIITEIDNNHVEALLQCWCTFVGEPIEYPTNALFQMDFDFSTTWLKYYYDKKLCEVSELYLTSNISKYETMMTLFLDSLNVKYLKNYRKLLDGLEVDYYIPEKSLAIEINPNSTHNSNKYAINTNRVGFGITKSMSYHYNKYKQCANKGVKLINLFEYDLDPVVFQQLTGPRLKHMILGYNTKIYARKIEIVKDDSKKDSREFLEKYHTQGASSATVYYKMIYKNELVGVASFGKRHNNDTELKRLCFKPGVQIVGGLSKVINRFYKDNQDVIEIYSFSDNNYGDGNGYQAAGAEFIKETGPSLVFVSHTDPRDRYSWQIATSWSMSQGVISQDPDYNQQTSNPNEYVELYLSHRNDNKKGYDRIYTAGSKLWKFTRKG